MRIDDARNLYIGDSIVWKPDGTKGSVIKFYGDDIDIKWESGETMHLSLHDPWGPWDCLIKNDSLERGEEGEEVK